jgi:hypothetical protein
MSKFRRLFSFVIDEMRQKFGLRPSPNAEFRQLSECHFCEKLCVDVHPVRQGVVGPNVHIDFACFECFPYVIDFD